MLDPATNFAKSKLIQGYSATDTTITIDANDLNLSQWPDPATAGEYNAVWWDATLYPDPADDPNREIIRVTGKNQNVLTVLRAQEGTTATAKNTSGSTYKIAIVPTAKLINDISDYFIDVGAKYAWITDDPYNAVGDGVTNDRPAFQKAIDDGVSTIIIPAGTYLISSDLTFPASIGLFIFHAGAQFSIPANVTVTLNGFVQAPVQNLKTGSGTLGIASSYQMFVDPYWYGASDYLSTYKTVSFGGPVNLDYAPGYGELHIGANFNHLLFYGTAPPSSGTWVRGDWGFHTQPSAGGIIGWRCIEAGTPGTWENIPYPKSYDDLFLSLESGDFAVDSTGQKNQTIAHGQSTPPSASDLHSIVLRQTAGWGGTAVGFRAPFLGSIDSTNVYISVYVTAAGSSGATARVKVIFKK